jgi:hypothetical protein
MKPAMPLEDNMLPRPDNILKMFWPTKDVSDSPNTMDMSEEPDKPLNSD